MPFDLTYAASSSASFQLVLPPSMTMSPGWPRSASSWMVCVVGSPAGTITHITRGLDSNALTNSSSVCTPTAPCDTCICTASGDRSYAIMRWPRLTRRSTMLPPMRPNPTIPISMVIPSGERPRLFDGRFHCRCECFPTRRHVTAERHPERREAARGQRLEVADGLRLLEDREAERLTWNRYVLGIRLHDLKEHTGPRPTLVELAGRVQEARPVAGRGCMVQAVSNRSADCGDRGFRCRSARGVGHGREIGALLRAAEQRLEIRARFCGGDGIGRRQLAAAPVIGEHLFRVVLRLLNIGLVESVDAQNRPGDRGRDLPAQEFTAKVQLVAHRQRDHRLSRLFQRRHRPVRRIAVHADVHEEAIVSVNGRLADWLTLDGYDALPLLPSALGDELLDPVAEGRHLG